MGNADRCTVKISCPSCAAKYSIADEKVQDKLAKIRCRKCGTTIVIDGKVDPPSVYAGDATASQVDAPQVSDPAAGGAVGPGEYSVDFGDNDQRTMTVAEIVAAYNAGTMTAETFVWADGMADWQPMGQVPALVDALHAAASAPAAAAAPPSAIHSSDIASPAPAAAPWEPAKPAEAPRAAARAGGGRGSTADLFGSSFEGAGSEADVTTSAREPAPALGLGSSASAGGTGARNESSVLFSLSALTATAAPAAASPAAKSAGATTATKEDSGLIDLKALTAASDQPAPMAPLAPSPLGMAPPLGLAPPLGGGVEAQIAAPMTQPAKSKAGIFIGAGIAVAAIAIAAAIVVVGKGQPPPPAPTPVAAPAPTPTPTPAPTPTEETTAKPPATGTAAEDEKKPAATAKKPATGGPIAKPAAGGTKPAAGGETKPAAGGDKPKPKPSGGCGCAPGDLQCAMKCAAGGG